MVLAAAVDGTFACLVFSLHFLHALINVHFMFFAKNPWHPRFASSALMMDNADFPLTTAMHAHRALMAINNSDFPLTIEMHAHQCFFCCRVHDASRFSGYIYENAS